MPHWGPHFVPDPEGDFVLNLSPERPHFAPRGPSNGGLSRRLTTPSRPRPLSFQLAAPATEIRSPHNASPVYQGQIATVTRSPTISNHRRSLSSNFRNYDVSTRSPVDGVTSRSPAMRSPRILATRSPRPEGFAPVPEAQRFSSRSPQYHMAPPVVVHHNVPEIRHDYGSDADESPRVTVAESNRRNRREREYRETANRRRAAGFAPPERGDSDEDADDTRDDHPRAEKARKHAQEARRSASAARDAPSADREKASRSRSNATEVTRTREYRRTYEREKSRRSPASQERSGYSRSPSQATLSPVSSHRPRAHTLSSASPNRPAEGTLLLEDGTADRAKHLVQERAIFGRQGKKTTQYQYA